jgi:hypothetical protein
MSFVHPWRSTMESILNDPCSTSAIVMYVRTFSFGLLMAPMYGKNPT